MGCDAFSDLTPEEFAARYTGGYVEGLSFGEAATYVDAVDEGALPAAAAAVDWRDAGAVTPVKDQKACGGCWAFSATGAVESAHFLRNKVLVSLSEQQLLDCRAGGKGCAGGSAAEGFYTIQHTTHGSCGEVDYPYVGKDAPCRKGCAPVARVTGQHAVGKNSEVALRLAVTARPVSVAVEANQGVFQYYASGVMDSPCGHNLDPAVLAVGYGATNETAAQAYWIIKNSWGKGWGEGGYIRLGRGDNFTAEGQCGVQKTPVYPEVAAANASSGV